MIRILPFLVLLFVWIFALIDLISTDESAVRNLPKIVWLFVVLLFPLVGALLWFLVGRPNGGSPSRGRQRRTPPVQRPPIGPEDTPEWRDRFGRPDKQ